MQDSKYTQSPQNESSSFTVDTFNRKPRFQRQSLLLKSQGKSNSKSKHSTNPMSLEKLYVKNAFFKPTCGLFHQQPQHDEPYATVFDKILLDGSPKTNIFDYQIDHKNDCQHFHVTNYFTNFKQESFLSNFNIHEENMKEQTDKSLKQANFYKQKCLKHELRIKNMLKEEQKLRVDLNNLRSENQNLKLQIQSLKNEPSLDINTESSKFYTEKKPRSSVNNKISRLKQQYLNFREQQDLVKLLFDQKITKINQKFEQVNAQNEKLRENLARQNQLYNQKLKMMQSKQDFLQKTLSFTKNSLTQLQKDYNEKQIEIIDSKRLNQIINEKNIQIEKLQSKYNNLLKIIIGDKKKNQILKVTKNQQERLNIPPNGCRNTIGTKKILFHQKQINLQNNMKGKQKFQNKDKLEQSSLKIKLSNSQVIKKQNYRMNEVKNTVNLPTQQISQQERFLKRNGSDLTISSFNSFELSPQK